VAGTGFAGTASNQLYLPWDLTLDWANTLYVTDRFNHRVQKFLMNAASGTTIAGQMNGTSGMNMNQFNQPTGIYVDLNGDIFISDTNNNRAQFWSNGASSGQTLVGNGRKQFPFFNPSLKFILFLVEKSPAKINCLIACMSARWRTGKKRTTCLSKRVVS
jgi:hypothetical protein